MGKHLIEHADLTQRQHETLELIKQIIAEEGRPPTFPELKDRLGITLYAAYLKVKALREHGYLEVFEGKRQVIWPKGWGIVDEEGRQVKRYRKADDRRRNPSRGARRVAVG